MNDTELSDESRYRLLKLVDAKPELSQRQLARELGISVGKLNYCLKSLIGVGLIKVGNFARSNHKLGYVYLLTPQGVHEKARVTRNFLDRKQKEFDCLRKEIERLKLEVKDSDHP